MTDCAAPPPPILTREELRELVREVLTEQHELLGQPIDTADARDEVRADAAFLRRLRLATDGAASKVGYAVIMALVAAVGSIVLLGLHAVGVKL